jgi:hypothetical protein
MARRRNFDANGSDPVDPIVVACDTWSTGNSTIIAGNTYRASHPAVQERPQAFLLWANSTTAERDQRNRELVEEERRRVGLA